MKKKIENCPIYGINSPKWSKIIKMVQNSTQNGQKMVQNEKKSKKMKKLKSVKKMKKLKQSKCQEGLKVSPKIFLDSLGSFQIFHFNGNFGVAKNGTFENTEENPLLLQWSKLDQKSGP